MHGNAVLAGYVAGYDREKRFRQSGHTLERLTEPLDRIPDERITPLARLFGKAMVAVAYEHLTRVAK